MLVLAFSNLFILLATVQLEIFAKIKTYIMMQLKSQRIQLSLEYGDVH